MCAEPSAHSSMGRYRTQEEGQPVQGAKVLVTGATGNVGSFLIDALSRRGAIPVAAVRPGTTAAHIAAGIERKPFDFIMRRLICIQNETRLYTNLPTYRLINQYHITLLPH